MQEVGKFYYYLRDYENAYPYYKKFIEITEAWNLDIYPSENAKIGVVFEKMGLLEESEKCFIKYKDYADNDHSIYKQLSLSAYYSFHGDTEKALENLRLFSEQDNYFYWMVIFIEIDPLMDNIKDLPEFKKIIKKIDTKFWKYNKRVKASLREKDLI
jgi:tetratricopeptide (TPR) repeat protein